MPPREESREQTIAYLWGGHLCRREKTVSHSEPVSTQSILHPARWGLEAGRFEKKATSRGKLFSAYATNEGQLDGQAEGKPLQNFTSGPTAWGGIGGERKAQSQTFKKPDSCPLSCL